LWRIFGHYALKDGSDGLNGWEAYPTVPMNPGISPGVWPLQHLGCGASGESLPWDRVAFYGWHKGNTFLESMKSDAKNIPIIFFALAFCHDAKS
jgi:hypothetical protein